MDSHVGSQGNGPGPEPPKGSRSSESVAAYEADLLERVSLGRPLAEVLDRLVIGFEALWPDTVASVQLVEPDGKALRLAAGPRVPEVQRGMRFAIGPRHGSCGTAAYRREVVIVDDIESDPLWTEVQDVALPYGLRACWSVPVVSADGAVLATFAVYHRQPRAPGELELALVKRVAHLVRIALENSRRERALRASEERFRRVFAEAATGLVVFDLSGRILEANDAYAKMVGATAEALRGAEPQLCERVPGGLSETLRDLAAGRRESFVLTERLRHADGHPVWAKVSGSIAHDSEGCPLAMSAVVEDITEHHGASEALREREAMYQIAAQVGRMGAWRVESASYVHRWSREALLILGAPVGTALTWEEIYPRFAEADRDTLTYAFRRCERDGTPFDHEIRAVRFDGAVVWLRVIGEAAREAPTSEGEGRIVAVHGVIQDIDEVVRLRRRTRELADRLVATLESLTDPFMTLDRDWGVNYVNGATERLMGMSRADMVGRRLGDLFPVFGGSTIERALMDAMTLGQTGHVDAFSQTLQRWIDVTAYPTPEGLAAYIKDITELRQSREALRESEERFELLARATTDAMWDWRVESNLLWWSEGLRDIFGYDPASVDPTLRSWTDHIHPNDRERVMASIGLVMSSDAPTWYAEYRFRHAEGHYIDVVDRAQVVRNTEGRVVRMVGGVSDVTERKLAEDRVREQAMLLDKAQDAIIVLTEDHRVRYWNHSAANLYGWGTAEAIGASFEVLVHEDPTVFRAATVTVQERGEWVGEVEQVTRAGRRVIVEGRWTLLTNERGEPSGILALHTDVTEKRRLEHQYLRAQRLESIGTLAGGIAHDLNNMLTPILITTSGLRSDEANANIAEDLASIQQCADRGAQMVRQLLVFARGSDGRRVQLNPRTVAAEVYKFMRETLPKNIDLELVAPEDIWDIDADSTQIHQLITNLCVNARDALPHGGTLTISLENTVLDELYTGMNLEARPGPYVLLRVEDTGVGMAPEVVDRVFEPFFTTKAIGQGSGLGLSTVHAIVRGHRGFIHVYSELGLGSRFKVYLPASRMVSEDSQVRAEQVQLPRGRGELVLVVDDEEIIRHVTTRMLERYGYRVVTAQNGAEAVALYAQMKDDIALVLTDMSMPVMDGPSTIVALRAIDPRVRIIGSSGLNANGHLAKAVDAGVDVFVAKPYTAEAMLRTIRRVLGRGDVA